MTAGTSSWGSARTVLCVRLDSIGDVLMTTPAIRAIKESSPDRRVILLTSPAGADVARLIPEVDKVLVYRAPWMKASPAGATAREDHKTIELLKALEIDAAVVFTVYSQSPLPAAFMCYLAGIPLRLAYCRENPYHLLTDWALEKEPLPNPRHEVMRQLDLVLTIGCSTKETGLSLRVPQESGRTINRLLRGLGLDRSKPFVVIHPGATAPSRRYPAESFSRLGEYLANDLGVQVVFTGTEPETHLIETIRGRMRVQTFSLAGKLTLGGLSALLALSSFLISNNTGPAHMAAALGTPVVSLYALTNPQHVPWNVPSRVLFHDVSCKYCYKSVCPKEHNHCLSLLSPKDVFSAASDLFFETRGSRRVGKGRGAPSMRRRVGVP